jgi:predicted dehydrogenase
VSPEHIRAAQTNGLEICALADCVPGQREENLGAFPGLADTPFYTDYREMLERERPALTAIATPSGLHAVMALDAIAAGSHVIIEKPIAMTLEDADRIAEAAAAKGAVVCNNLQNRFNPAVQELRRAVDAGRFGRILSAALQLRWHRGDDYYAQAAWRGTRALDGGAMMNQSIHGIDLVNWLLGGCPESIAAQKATLLRSIESEDIAVAALRFRTGALASLECMTIMYAGAQEETIQISGTQGMVRLGGSCAQEVEAWRFADSGPEEEAEMRRRYGASPESVYGHGHTLLYADVLAAIREGHAPLVDAAAGKQALAIVLGAYESAESGKTVAFSDAL